jgi:RsiW-degrading membrane proteinase PrsW (M82 family)
MSSTSETLLAGRRRALDQAGWGEPFRPWQPHNAAFWVSLAGGLLGIRSLVDELGHALPAYRTALVLGAVAFGLYAVPLWLVIRRVERYGRRPGALAAAGFAWGALAATFWLALAANQALLGLLAKTLGQSFAYDWGAALVAPVVEEPAKASGVVLLLALAPRLVRTARDGLVVGAFVGLGFQIAEDVTSAYNQAVVRFGAHQAVAVLQVLVIRGITGIVSHTLFSALCGLGLVWLLGRPGEQRRPERGLAFVGAALLFHGLCDGAFALGGGNGGGALLIWLLVAAASIRMLVLGLRFTAPRQRAWLRAVLAPEVELGVLSAAELDAACAGRRERKALVAARTGVRERRVQRRRMRGAARLGRELARAGGAETPRVERARDRLARARLQPARA